MGEAQAKWLALASATRTRLQVGLVVVGTLTAYYYSLSSLLQTLGFETPLAYLALVPLIASALAWFYRKPVRPEPTIQDRHLDYIIGVPLLAIALSINEFLPRSQSVLFWLRRMDLISLPFFVAGLVAIVFGTRVLWRQKVPILYLFLAWPWPYTTILLGSLNGFTNFTIFGLNASLGVFHFARPIGTPSAGLYQITHNGVGFPVSVVTACSGVDGMVGFFLVGAAFAALVRGPRLRKGIWLASGLVLLWLTNLGRLVLIFWAGKQWGEQVALKVLHPVAGLIIFNIGVIFMVVLLRPFGLKLGRANHLGHSTPAERVPPKPNRPQPIFMAAGIVVALTLILNVNNTSLKSFDLVAGAAGDAKMPSFLANPATPQGWSREFTDEYFNGKTLFGESSRWFRYTYFDRGGGDLSANVPVTADVINAAGVSAFGAYGVEACYNFHGYKLRDVAGVSLGFGIDGQALSFSTPGGDDWSILYWIWPVKTGTQTRYERVILYMQNTKYEQVRLPAGTPGVTGAQGALNPTSSLDERLITNRRFLVAFAKEVVAGQTKMAVSASNIGQLQPPGAVVPPPTPTETPQQRLQQLLDRSHQNKSGTPPLGQPARSHP
jgi:exosortase/archaeosortase family protein